MANLGDNTRSSETWGSGPVAHSFAQEHLRCSYRMSCKPADPLQSPEMGIWEMPFSAPKNGRLGGPLGAILSPGI